MKPTTLPTPEFLVVRVTRSSEEIYFHTHRGDEWVFPVGSVTIIGTSSRPGVSVRDPDGREVYSAPLTLDASARLAVCLHGDGVYSWVETQTYGPSVPVTAQVENGEVTSYIVGEGETALVVSETYLREGQVTYMNGIYTALRMARRVAHLGGAQVTFTPAPVEAQFKSETTCEGCGLPIDGEGACPVCQENERVWNASLDDLEARINPILDGWAAEWAIQGMKPVDLSSAVEMALGIIKGQRVAGF